MRSRRTISSRPRAAGGYDLWQIAEYMAYPFSAAKRLLGDQWAYTRLHRDTAIAFVRFILASRGTVEARTELDRQLRADQLRSELAKVLAASAQVSSSLFWRSRTVPFPELASGDPNQEWNQRDGGDRDGVEKP